MVNNNIFSCGPFSANDAYVWTIVSRLGDMLSKAEDLFGERDKEYTILGVEIANIEQPQIWYPASGKSVIIKITENCIGDMEEAIFQVAHEAVHCLCPNPNKNTTILEEGLATYFSIYYTKELGIDKFPDSQKYIDVYILVSKLLEYDIKLIKKARTIMSDISLIDKEMLLKICYNIDPILAGEVTKKFGHNQ